MSALLWPLRPRSSDWMSPFSIRSVSRWEAASAFDLDLILPCQRTVLFGLRLGLIDHLHTNQDEFTDGGDLAIVFCYASF
jgi:hypothetical protein